MRTTRATARRLTVGLIALAVPFAAACGNDDADDNAVTVTDPTPDVEDAPASELVITMDPGDGNVEEWTLTCDPDGGTHPDPAAACEALDELDPEVMQAVPDDAMCTMIHGGPHTATISGHWGETSVSSEFSRENGCEIARWDAVVELVRSSGDGELS
jgi:hypothetical protein